MTWRGSAVGFGGQTNGDIKGGTAVCLYDAHQLPVDEADKLSEDRPTGSTFVMDMPVWKKQPEIKWR